MTSVPAEPVISTPADENEHVCFELVQRGIVVASVEGQDREWCFNEIMHYARQYAEDGPCIVREGNVETEVA